MTQEVFTGPIQQIQGKQVELTVVGINPKLNKERSIFMPDGGMSEQPPKPKQPVVVPSSVDTGPASMPAPGGMFEGLSPAERADAIRTMNLPGFPQELARDLGMDVRAGVGQIAEIREGLPAKGEANVENRAATPPAMRSAGDILTGIDPATFGDPNLQRVAHLARKLAENNEARTELIDELRDSARKMFADGADQAQYDALDQELRQARAATRRIEREIVDVKLIELVSQHPRLRPFLDEVNAFISRVKNNQYDEEEHANLLRRIERSEAPGIRNGHVDPATRLWVVDNPAAGDYSSNEQFDDFDYAQALLKGAMSESVFKARREGRITPESTKELMNGMLLAGTEGDTPEAVEARNQGYDAIEQIIKAAQPESREEYSMIIESAIQQIESTKTYRRNAAGDYVLDAEGNRIEEGYRGQYDHVIEFVLEFGLERIFSQADKTSLEDYPQFSLYVTDNIDRLIYMSRVYDETRARNYPEWLRGEDGSYPEGYDPKKSNPDLFGYLVNLRSKRRTMHELFRGMRDPNTYLQYVTQLLRKTGFKFVEKDIVGVKETQQIYEQVLSSALALKKQGWLTDHDFEQVDIDVEQILKQSAEQGSVIKNIKRADGTVVGRKIREWEAERAAKMGRSLSAASQRRIVYAVMGELPDNPDLLYKSVESEYIARRLAPLKLFADRFFGQPLAAQLMGFIHRELKRDIKTGEMDYGRYGYIVRDPKTGEPIVPKEEAKGKFDKAQKLRKVKLRGGKWVHAGAGEHGEEPVRGLYGQSQDAADILDLMIWDPKSNSWRGRLMFLDQKDFATQEIDDGHGHHRTGTLRDYLFTLQEKHHLGHHGSEENKKAFAREIAPVIADQRLSLGILMRHPDLGDSNLEVIWKNAAKFIPSRIAAMFPKETEDLISRINRELPAGEAVSWLDQENGSAGLRGKLWRAERLRVAHDASVLRVDGPINIIEQAFGKEAAGRHVSVEQLKEAYARRTLPADVMDRLSVVREAQIARMGGESNISTRDLDTFFTEVGMSPQEERVVRILQGLGRHFSGEEMRDTGGSVIEVNGNAQGATGANDSEYVRDGEGFIYFNIPSASEISKIKQPFAAFLDDVPQTDWENLSDEDFNRILVSDQNDYAEGYGALVGFIADPVKKVEEFVEVFAKTFHKIQSPPGVNAAQARLEAFINAGLMQRRANAIGKLTGGLLKDFRSFGMTFPRSPMEIFNMQANIADNEKNQLDILKALAQKDVIADDPNPDDLDHRRRTQYLRMLDDNDANKKAQWRGFFREFLQLLGPVFFKQAFGSFDMKGLGLE